MQAKYSIESRGPLSNFVLNSTSSHLQLVTNKKQNSIILVSPEGDIEFINPAFSEISGYTLFEAVKLNFRSIISDIIPDYYYFDMWNSVLNGNEWRNYLAFRKKNGEIYLSETEIYPVKNKKGEVKQLLVIKSYIAEGCEEVNKVNNLLKFGYYGNIFCSLMHELKSHFAVIKMNFSLLKPSGISEVNIYSIIERDLERISKFFTNFSQLAKNKELEIIELDIRNVIDLSYSTIKPLSLNKKINFINNAEHFTIKGDYQKLKILFKNLIENSIEAIEDSGNIEVWSDKVNGYYVIYFSDTGCGIKNSNTIFEPFSTTKANGTGLGLAIVKRIIEEHGGCIRLINSRTGKTTFEIRYPL